MFGMSALANLSRIPGSPYIPAVALPAPIPVAPERTPRKTRGPGGLLLEYPELDLRPHQELFLQSVPLDMLDAGANAICVQCDVTAKNADGKLESEILMPVAASTMDLSGIFTDAEEPDSEDYEESMRRSPA
jgi:hypothetical protein